MNDNERRHRNHSERSISLFNAGKKRACRVFIPWAGGIGRIAMIMIRAALAVLAIAASAAIDARPAAAVTYRPWCVQYGGGSGNNGLTCAFSSFEQCMMTGGPGTGGSCVQNPWYLWYGEHGQGRVADDRRRVRRQ
jgi:hypothetical protein